MARSRKRAPSRRGARRRTSRWKWALGTVAGAWLAQAMVIDAYTMPSRAMEDTLLPGDALLVDKFTFGAPLPVLGLRLPAFGEPQPGDVIVFRSVDTPGRIHIQRVVATGGHTVEVRDKAVLVDGERLPDPPRSKYVDARILPASRSHRDNMAAHRVPEGHLFVLGDNRDDSRDSRQWGLLPRDHVLGRPLAIAFSATPPPAGEGLASRLASLPSRLRWGRLGAAVR